MKKALRFVMYMIPALALAAGLLADSPFMSKPVPAAIAKTAPAAAPFHPTFEEPVGRGPYDPRSYRYTTWLPNCYDFATAETATQLMEMFGAAAVMERDYILPGSPYSVLDTAGNPLRVRMLLFCKGTRIPRATWYWFWGDVTLAQDLEVNAGRLAQPYDLPYSPEEVFPGLARQQALAYLRLAAQEAGR